MKKICLLVVAMLAISSTNAQDDPDLLGTWYLHYIETNGNIMYVPSNGNPAIVQPTIVFSNLVTNPLETNVDGDSMCNSFLAHYELPGNHTIVIPFWSTTLVFCDETVLGGSSLVEVEQYEFTYFSTLFDYPNGSTSSFSYTVDTTNNILTMVGLLGEKLVYGRQVLSTENHDGFSSNIQLFPNPVQKELFMTGLSPNTQKKYTVYNLMGNVSMLERSLKQNSLDVSSLKAGMYFIRIEQQGKIAVKKFVKF